MKHRLIDLMKAANVVNVDGDVVENFDRIPDKHTCDAPAPFTWYLDTDSGYRLGFNPDEEVELIAGTAVFKVYDNVEVQVGAAFQMTRSLDDFDVQTAGMTPHTPGDPCPVAPETLVECLLGGERESRLYDPTAYPAEEWSWGVPHAAFHHEGIVAWKLASALASDEVLP